jgi:uncharacterized RDD family membrane protein YckC
MEDVVTGEAVVLEVPCARFPSRMVALAIDIAIQLILLAVLLVVVGTAKASGSLDGAAAAAIGLSGTVLIIVGYPTIFETAGRGRSPGKLAMGLRVVGDDGGPERFRQALVRALASVLEIWLLLGAPALITSLLSGRGKRLGDIFAGTFVIQERLRANSGTAVVMPPTLAAWAASLELSGLPDETAAIARSYLSRFGELTPVAREEFGRRIAAEVAARVAPPPPGTPAAAYLSAVLAERSSRDLARMSRNGLGRPEAGPAGYGTAGYGTATAGANADGAWGAQAASGAQQPARPRPSSADGEATAGPSRTTARPGQATAPSGETEALLSEAEALPGGRFVPPA